MKRVIDLALGLVAAVLTLPIVLVLAVVLAIELRAWPFFVQQRVGRGGELFRIVKLRTLPTTTARDADKYALAEVAVPRVAQRLRNLHLDELPQLWLVVSGRMSLVGPRPEMPHLHAQLSPEVQEARTRLRPGCTGLWQISVDAGGLIHEHPEYDLTYVETASVGLDWWILWRTLGLLSGGRRVVTLDDVLAVEPVPHETLVLPTEALAEDPAAI